MSDAEGPRPQLSHLTTGINWPCFVGIEDIASGKAQCFGQVREREHSLRRCFGQLPH